ncbi:MAG: metallophosphoesterase [Bacteroidales bacterium]|nr:metallophosphoesterase [Bacteroidales bacterium]MCF8458846.1 metallophosphoesterase [Bacteroidales bacterium]
MKNLFSKVLILFLFVGLLSCQEEKPGFSFCFLTDIHLETGQNAVAGFQKAIGKVNEMKPDFVITGGDLIMDALGQSYGKSDSLYNLYIENQKSFAMPVYNTMGNHEVHGWYESSKADRNHPEFGEKMFEKRIGPRHLSFDHKGWHFIILDSVEEDEKGNAYFGFIDSLQMEWLKADLAKIAKETPIIVSTHIPFITAETQIENGPMAPVENGWVVNNSKEVLSLFENHNLKLVLQGHLHIFEDIYIRGIHFVTGGAVSAAWWGGPYNGTEEGFVQVHISGNELKIDYVDYGWEVEK